MRFNRRLRATALAFLVAGSSVLAHPDTLGVITQARSASLSNGPVSSGASVYDGDRLSTEVDGALTLRSGASMVYLGRESRVTLHNAIGEPKTAQVSLAAGTVVFSTAPAAIMEICAEDARIRPATTAPTLGQVTVAGPKSLFIFARRGSLKISYREESEVIAEGDSYRVVLDPPNDDASAKADASQPAPDARHRRRHKAFLLLLLGAAVVGAGAASIPLAMSKDYESPDHP